MIRLSQAYLLYQLEERHRSRSTVNLTSCAVRLLICDVLDQTERCVQLPLGRSPQPTAEPNYDALIFIDQKIYVLKTLELVYLRPLC